MTNLGSVLKSRDIIFLTKVCIVKAMVFPVVMYGHDSWTIKKPECQRIITFELWGSRRLLRVPWTSRRSNQSILKEISPEYSFEGTDVEAEAPILWPPDAKNWLIRKFKELTLWKRPWCRERLRVRGEGDDRGWDGWMASLTWWTWVWASSRIWWWTGKPGVLQSVGSQSWKWLSNWTELKVALNNRKVQKKTKNSLQFSIPSSFTETATQQEKDPNEPRPKQKISGITSHHHLRPRNLRSCSSIPSPWLQPKKVPVVLNQGRMAPVGAFGKVWFA